MKILLVVYDNDSHLHEFPIGLAYIAAVLIKEGHEVEVYSQDLHHYPDEHLTEYLDNNEFDVVGLSVIAGYYQYQKLLDLSEAINRSKRKPIYVLGGHGPAPEPEFFMKKTQADVIVIGEGEETTAELFRALENKQPLDNILGIAYNDGGECKVNPRRPNIKDVDSIPFPAYHKFPMEYYRLVRMPKCNNNDFTASVLSSRGCTFKCNFCYRLDKGFRARSPEAIIEEIQLLQKDYRITYISFLDELLMSSIKRTVELCEAFIKAKLKFKWFCSGRLNYAKPDVLKLMKEAGCVFVSYGIESMDDVALKNMDKHLTVKEIYKGIEETYKQGISPGFNIIFGNIGETKEILDKGVDFLIQYDDGAQLRNIRPVTPYPGSPLYYHAIQNGLLKDVEEFYEKKHLNSDLLAVNFTNLTDEEFNEALCEANVKLMDNHFEKKKLSWIDQTKKLYLEKDVSFRGYRHS